MEELSNQVSTIQSLYAKIFIKHKLSTDDAIHLSDSDSKNIIQL